MASHRKHRKPRSRPALFSPRVTRAARTAAGVAGVTMAGAVSLTHLTAVGRPEPAPEPGPVVSSAAAPSAPTRADLLDQEADRTGPPVTPAATPAAPRQSYAPLLLDPAQDPQAVLQGAGRLDQAAALEEDLRARFGPLPAT
ncbi:hypothetical protein P3T37_005336 [Kitasatospora sp. MAA4]|uniref:hypothetical protein n=1 Tax=Kitasatospora sp. MAA4 TaxID=3035093 RepID=UPI00247458CB|nr:hypothetical protein [Kitasatospora sp. MAA4]MDH6135917.1 hypothetical protein [Kitasatospora sp. MAA4]